MKELSPFQKGLQGSKQTLPFELAHFVDAYLMAG